MKINKLEEGNSRNTTEPKYYYTCPIKALYMMKEFGVRICKENQDVSNWNLADLLCIDFGRIYVAPESEHIFEPKKGDEGRWLRPIGAHYANHNGEQWVSAGIEPNPPEIIMRDNKQFFIPEVENA
jgi:hypothetical protein